MKPALVILLGLGWLANAADPPAVSPIAASSIEAAGLHQLLTLRRIYVDRLTGGETAAQMRDILISSMAGARLFILTEKEDKADAILRGAAEDLVFSETHQSSDGINAHANLSGTRGGYGSHVSNAAGIGIGDNESEHSVERRHEAIAAVRLVNKDGDVIWSTTQESLGAKFHGASADVAEKITQQLKDDFDKAQKLTSPSSPFLPTSK
ncbi:MAG: hypothetical protein ABSH49_21260 [Bryobacteraceae bacterium]|jgi:hypothetical protein